VSYATTRNAEGLNAVLTGAILHPHEDEPPVSEEKKATFYAAAELNVRYPLFPLETKY
jgi:hypothetical protein